MAIKRVWIEDGCITCGACEAECPDVFSVKGHSSTIRGSVREDGIENENRVEKSLLKADIQASLSAGIESAAQGCPVEVIKTEA